MPPVAIRSRISYWPKRSGPELETEIPGSPERPIPEERGGGAAPAMDGFGRADILMPESVSEIILSISKSVEKRAGVAGGGGSVPEAGNVAEPREEGRERIPERVSRSRFSTSCSVFCDVKR